jgi:hypothetical protein
MITIGQLIGLSLSLEYNNSVMWALYNEGLWFPLRFVTI